MSRIPSEPFFARGHPVAGQGVRPGQVDMMGTNARNPGRPGMNPFRTGAPDSSSANFGMSAGNYQVPGTEAHSFSGRDGFQFDPNVSDVSAWGAEGLPSRKQIILQKTVTPKAYKVDYVSGTPMFTKRMTHVVPTDDIAMDTANYFTPAELNAFLRQHSYLYRNGHDIIKEFRCDGILNNSVGLEDSLYGSGRLDIPLTQVNVMKEGDIRTKNLWGDVNDNDHVYVIFKILPVPHYPFNFTVSNSHVSKVNFDPEGITSGTDFTDRNRKMRSIAQADADMDPFAGRGMSGNSDTAAYEASTAIDVGRINARATSKKPDWRPTAQYSWQVTFGYGPTRTPPLSMLEFDYLAFNYASKGPGMSEASAETKMITGVGAYQCIGTVGYVMPKERGIVSQERATQACHSHAILQTTPGFNLDVRVHRPIALEWAEAM